MYNYIFVNTHTHIMDFSTDDEFMLRHLVLCMALINDVDLPETLLGHAVFVGNKAFLCQRIYQKCSSEYLHVNITLI